MATREVLIERAGQRILTRAGILSEKRGANGWPDREVYVAPGRHEWIEWKRPGGRLTPAQRIRIPKLTARGEIVHVIDNLVALDDLIYNWRLRYGPPTHSPV